MIRNGLLAKRGIMICLECRTELPEGSRFCNFIGNAFKFFFDRLDLGSVVIYRNMLVRVLALESYRDDYYCPKLVKYGVNGPVSLCGMNTKDIFLAYHHLMSRGTRVYGKLSDIGNNEGGSSGRYLEYPLYIAFGMA
jgi:hypothetical protein